MKKVLLATLHRPDRAPSQRFRIEQYLNYLSANGFDIEFSYLLDEKDDKLFYQSGGLGAKGLILLKSIKKRLLNLFPAQKYDLVFIQREAFMLGTSFFEKLMKKSGAKLIFDFDDAIWLPNISEGNKKLAFLKNPAKTEDLIRIADLVFAGNAYLKQYALRFNPKVVIVPTTIDTEVYQKPATQADHDAVCIGWSGSLSTIEHFKYLLPVLEKLKQKYADKISFKVIGDANFQVPALGIKGMDWKREEEVPEISSFDIGIMPLPDDDWTKGKCGLKGLQYMALEVPTIMSAVGVNTKIISDGENGFLARNEDEWFQKLCLLIENSELRKRVGKEGRKTVKENYSVQALQESYLHYFRQVADQV